MPANLPMQYHEVEKRFRSARSTPEKIAALQEMLAIMPKHKGTDHLKADLRAKLARLMDEMEKPTGKAGARFYPFAIRREGAGQVVLIGTPNSGKSSLLTILTGANAKIAPYPFSTQLPTPGMLRFENVYIQLVDTPPLAEGRLENRLFGLFRNADVLVIVVDLSMDAIGQVDFILSSLGQWAIEPLRSGQQPDPDQWQTQKPTILAANKADFPGALDEYQRLTGEYGDQFKIVMTAATEDVGLDELSREIFAALRAIRVYTKRPGGETIYDDPMVMPIGSTVEEAAIAIHKDWQSKLKFAVLWGSAKFEGQRVGRDYVLADGDVLEMHG